MYVNSSGVSGFHPVRYGCMPEVTRFVLRNARATTGFPGLEGQTAHGRKRKVVEPDCV